MSMIRKIRSSWVLFKDTLLRNRDGERKRREKTNHQTKFEPMTSTGFKWKSLDFKSIRKYFYFKQLITIRVSVFVSVLVLVSKTINIQNICSIALKAMFLSLFLTTSFLLSIFLDRHPALKILKSNVLTIPGEIYGSVALLALYNSLAASSHRIEFRAFFRLWIQFIEKA